MKKLLIPLFALAVLAGCSDNGEFTLNGKIDPAILEQMKGAVVYMAPAEKEMVAVDSVAINDSVFSMKGIAKEAEVYNLYMQNNQVIGQFIAESGKLNCEFGMMGVKVSGSELNDKRNEMEAKMQDLSKDLNNAFMKAQMDGTEEAKQEAEKLYEEAMRNANKLATEVYTENANNALGIMAMTQVLVTAEDLDLQTLDSLLAINTNGKVANDWRIKETRESFLHKEATKEGKKFVDFEGQTLEGQPSRFSDFVGKGDYILVDFWASWCGPCKGEIKFLKEINEYAEGKNLKVLSVSVWDKIENIISTVETEGLVWNHIFDGKNVATEQYGINGIPQIMLIGPDGTILKRDLRGEEMVNYIKETVK